VSSTGDKYAYATTTARLARASGTQDVYLVFSAGLRLSTFRIG
jgi:beta-glucosidase